MKLVKQKYRTLKGEIKTNCYIIKIPRVIIEQSEINEEDELEVKVIDGKIIIERKQNDLV